MSCDFERDEVRAELVNSTLLFRVILEGLDSRERDLIESIGMQLNQNRKVLLLKREGSIPLLPIGDETSHSPDTP